MTHLIIMVRQGIRRIRAEMAAVEGHHLAPLGTPLLTLDIRTAPTIRHDQSGLITATPFAPSQNILVSGCQSRKAQQCTGALADVPKHSVAIARELI